MATSRPAKIAPLPRIRLGEALNALVWQVLLAPEALPRACRVSRAALPMCLERPRARGVGLENQAELKTLVASIASLGRTAIHL